MYQNKKRYALTNCVLLDGTEHMAPQTGKTVYISGDTIVDIGDGGQIAAGYEPVDLKGKYLLPGHCGYKFGTWYNMAWMEKTLGDHAVPPAAFVPFPELSV